MTTSKSLPGVERQHAERARQRRSAPACRASGTRSRRTRARPAACRSSRRAAPCGPASSTNGVSSGSGSIEVLIEADLAQRRRHRRRRHAGVALVAGRRSAGHLGRAGRGAAAATRSTMDAATEDTEHSEDATACVSSVSCVPCGSRAVIASPAAAPAARARASASSLRSIGMRTTPAFSVDPAVAVRASRPRCAAQIAARSCRGFDLQPRLRRQPVLLTGGEREVAAHAGCRLAAVEVAEQQPDQRRERRPPTTSRPTPKPKIARMLTSLVFVMRPRVVVVAGVRGDGRHDSVRRPRRSPPRSMIGPSASSNSGS